MILAVLSAVSCVYPFEAEITSTADRVVIEGDIVIGGETVVKVSRLLPLDAEPGVSEYLPSDVVIVSENGETYKAVLSGDGMVADTRNASPSHRYKLQVRVGAKTYSTSWLDVHQAPEIDGLDYSISDDRKQMSFSFSAHSTTEDHFFRVSYNEAWEYRADYYAKYYFYLPDPRKLSGALMKPYPDGTNTYYCWDTDQASEIMLISTESLSKNEILDQKLCGYSNHEHRLSYLYSIELELQTLSKDAYDYWSNLDQISSYSGSLFSPNPSEMRGNIRCDSDSTELVIGYINASSVSRKRIFVNNDQTAFYRNNQEIPELENTLTRKEWYGMYSNGYLPVDRADVIGDFTDGYSWAPARCVDCRVRGGNKNKPSYWPTDHK